MIPCLDAYGGVKKAPSLHGRGLGMGQSYAACLLVAIGRAGIAQKPCDSMPSGALNRL